VALAMSALSWLERPVPPGMSRGFRLFVAAKVALFAAAHGTSGWPVLLLCAGLTATGLARLGWLGMAAVLLAQLLERFPWTPNHHYVELALVACLAAYPREDGRPVRAAGLLVAMCFLGAGYQKLFHGRWHDGEYLAHALLYGPDWSCLPWLLRRGLGATAALGGLEPLPPATPAALGGASPSLPGWALSVCRLASWAAVLAELAVPVGVLHPATRRAALPLALGLQVVVSWAVGVWGFGLTGLGCWWTWSGDSSGRGYRALIAGAAAFALLGALCDTFGWLPWVWQ
jgi:hypothetical protein